MKEVTAAIIMRNGKVFIARRAPKEKFAGGWEFPGGKMEAQETPENCLRRELFEELGIETIVGEFFVESIYSYPQGEIRLLAYFVKLVSEKFTMYVHDDFQWVSPKDLLNYQLLPADIPIAEKLIKKFHME